MSTQTEAVRQTLAQHGVLAALGVLNDRTPYRFTGIYKLRGDEMHAMHVFDRTAQQRSWVRAIPLGKSLCQYAIQHGEFSVTSASTDHRFANHPYDGLVESYHGLLLVARDGTPYGTLIHFDIASCEIDADEMAFLRQVAPLFSPHLD
ncbi:MAG: GAF domain-containing protein [Comamonadaceae bacterium]|nr:MAG: GAF domain-containing protein [Comamonadaceae bacterium]